MNDLRPDANGTKAPRYAPQAHAVAYLSEATDICETTERYIAKPSIPNFNILAHRIGLAGVTSFDLQPRMVLAADQASELATALAGRLAEASTTIRRAARQSILLEATAKATAISVVLDLDLARRLAETLMFELKRDTNLSEAHESYYNGGQGSVELGLAQSHAIDASRLFARVAMATVPLKPDGSSEIDRAPDADLVEAGFLLLPAAEEARAYEVVWSLVEQAIDGGRLTREVEDELHRLGDIAQRSRHLVLDGGELILETVYQQIDKLLPDVLAAVTPESKHSPAQAALAAAAARAPEAEQLDAINAGMLQVAEDLAPIVDQLPDTPKPYFGKTNRRLNQAAERINATLPAIEKAEAAVRRFVDLRTAQGVKRVGKMAITAAATAALTAALEAKGIPVPEVKVSAAITAYMHYQVLKWIYARRRRQNSALPGVLQPLSLDTGGAEPTNDAVSRHREQES